MSVHNFETHSVPPSTGLSRRQMLALAAATVCQAPMRLAWAKAKQPWGKCVVVMLRGGMDGLAAVPALGDPAWSALREEATPDTPALQLDEHFSLHPSLAHLHEAHHRGELLTVHAVASAYRERSHFDAQNLIETGGLAPYALDTGWLGRALALGSGQALAVVSGLPLALRGSSRASTLTPSRTAQADDTFFERLQSMYASDPVLAARLQQGLQARNSMGMAMPADAVNLRSFETLCAQAAAALNAAADVAWLELDGWDTHGNQAARLARQFQLLDSGLARLRQDMAPRWRETTILVMTEFGRTAHYNGTNGTDHGTAGVAWVLGGSVRGGRVLTDWPGLAPADLLQGRDLRPTLDLRALWQPLLTRHLGLGQAELAQVLPGTLPPASDMWV